MTGKTPARAPATCFCGKRDLGANTTCSYEIVPYQPGIWHEREKCGVLVQKYEKGKGFTFEIERKDAGVCVAPAVAAPAQPVAPVERAVCVCLFPVRNGLVCSLCAGHLAT